MVPKKSLRIIVDINHPAHVHFFKNFIWAMQRRGHKVLVTASYKDISQDLLRGYHIPFVHMGTYGDNLLIKILQVPLMFWRMLMVGSKFKADIFLGIASSRAAQAAWVLGKKSILFDDTLYKPNILLYLPFVTKVYTPDCVKVNLGRKQIRYAGYHQLACLHPNYFRSDPSILGKYNLKANHFFVVRFVSWKAGHDLLSHGFTEKGKIALIQNLAKFGQPIITSESALPSEIEQYKLKIAKEKMHDLLASARIVVSEGGTMASEAAILGVPSVFVSSLNADTIDEQSQKYGLLLTFADENKAIQEIDRLLKQKNLQKIWQKKRQKLLHDKIDVTQLMINDVENLTYKP